MTLTVLACFLFSCTAARAHIPAWKQTWQYRWEVWLPAKWQRVARCETRLDWGWDSGTYVSAFGIYAPAYADDARHAGTPQWSRHPTPWQQYRTALAHYRLHGGFSGWGCRGA